MKRFFIGALGVLAFVLAFVAQTNAVNACIISYYEPDLPEELQE